MHNIPLFYMRFLKTDKELQYVILERMHLHTML